MEPLIVLFCVLFVHRVMAWGDCGASRHEQVDMNCGAFRDVFTGEFAEKQFVSLCEDPALGQIIGLQDEITTTKCSLSGCDGLCMDVLYNKLCDLVPSVVNLGLIYQGTSENGDVGEASHGTCSPLRQDAESSDDDVSGMQLGSGDDELDQGQLSAKLKSPASIDLGSVADPAPLTCSLSVPEHVTWSGADSASGDHDVLTCTSQGHEKQEVDGAKLRDDVLKDCELAVSCAVIDVVNGVPCRGVSPEVSPLGMPTVWSIPNFPVVRIFGRTPTGESVCARIHGWFPHFFVPVPLQVFAPLARCAAPWLMGDADEAQSADAESLWSSDAAWTACPRAFCAALQCAPADVVRMWMAAFVVALNDDIALGYGKRTASVRSRFAERGVRNEAEARGAIELEKVQAGVRASRAFRWYRRAVVLNGENNEDGQGGDDSGEAPYIPPSFVFDVRLCAAMPFYGFHVEERAFLRLSFFSSSTMMSAVDAIRSGRVHRAAFSLLLFHVTSPLGREAAPLWYGR